MYEIVGYFLKAPFAYRIGRYASVQRYPLVLVGSYGKRQKIVAERYRHRRVCGLNLLVLHGLGNHRSGIDDGSYIRINAAKRPVVRIVDHFGPALPENIVIAAGLVFAGGIAFAEKVPSHYLLSFFDFSCMLFTSSAVMPATCSNLRLSRFTTSVKDLQN